LKSFIALYQLVIPRDGFKIAKTCFQFSKTGFAVNPCANCDVAFWLCEWQGDINIIMSGM